MKKYIYSALELEKRRSLPSIFNNSLIELTLQDNSTQIVLFKKFTPKCKKYPFAEIYFNYLDHGKSSPFNENWAQTRPDNYVHIKQVRLVTEKILLQEILPVDKFYGEKYYDSYSLPPPN